MNDDLPTTDAGRAREALTDELRTITEYEEMADASSDEVLKAQLREVADDERVHVGNFAAVLGKEDPKAEPKMREGFEEALELRKSMFHSFKDMMNGASHFQKKRKNSLKYDQRYKVDKETTHPDIYGMHSRSWWGAPLTLKDSKLRQVSDSAKLVGEDNYINVGTRNADIPIRRYPWSRAQIVQAIAIGAARPLTYSDISGSELYDEEIKKGHIKFVYVGGTPYVVRYDPDDGRLHQIIRKTDKKGRIFDFYMTPRNWEHYSAQDPSIMTVPWAKHLYFKYNDRQAVRGKRKRSPVNGVLSGKMEDNFTSPLEREAIKGGGAYDDHTVDESDLQGAFDKARNESEQFRELSFVSWVLAMDPGTYAKEGPSVKEAIDNVARHAARVLGISDNYDPNDAEAADAIRKKVARTIYANPKHFIENPKVAESILDVAIQESYNSPGFMKKIADGAKKYKGTTSDKQYKQARYDANKTRSNRLKSGTAQVIGYDHDGKPMHMEDIGIDQAFIDLGKKEEERRKEIKNTKLIPKSVNLGPKLYNLGIDVPGKGKRPSYLYINNEKTLRRAIADKLVDQWNKEKDDFEAAQKALEDDRKIMDAEAVAAREEQYAQARAIIEEEKAKEELLKANAERSHTASKIFKEALKEGSEDEDLDFFGSAYDKSIESLFGGPLELDEKNRIFANTPDGWKYFSNNAEPFIEVINNFEDLPYDERRQMMGAMVALFMPLKQSKYGEYYVPRDFHTLIERLNIVNDDEMIRKVGNALGRTWTIFGEEADDIWNQLEEKRAEKERKRDIEAEEIKRLKDTNAKILEDEERYLSLLDAEPLKTANRLTLPEFKKMLESSEYDPSEIARGLRAGLLPKSVLDAVFMGKNIISNVSENKENDDKGEWRLSSDALKEYMDGVFKNGNPEDTALIYDALNGLKFKEGTKAYDYIKSLKRPETAEKKQLNFQTPAVNTHNSGADSALMGAMSSNLSNTDEIKHDLAEKPSDFKERDITEDFVDPNRPKLEGRKMNNYTNDPEEYQNRFFNGGQSRVKKTSFAESASFRDMLKSATDEKWKKKGLPAGSLEKTLPAYYRTVTIGYDKEAIDVYDHQKMPVGGDGISVKKVPGIGPKMSTKGDE